MGPVLKSFSRLIRLEVILVLVLVLVLKLLMPVPNVPAFKLDLRLYTGEGLRGVRPMLLSEVAKSCVCSLWFEVNYMSSSLLERYLLIRLDDSFKS